LFEGGGFEETVVRVVNRGGDADTTGGIVGMLAGALWGVEGVPGRWVRGLEAGVRGECEGQALSLLRLAPRGA
jgi:ADP-ribosyl-[dinitrogen reductase] hydrolase